MAIPRASSGMLRSQIRPAARTPAPLLRLSAGATRGTAKTHGKDDLGGPGGQEPRPSKPQGPDALKRNWYSTTTSSSDDLSTDDVPRDPSAALEPLVEEEEEEEGGDVDAADVEASARLEDIDALRDSRNSSTSSTSTATPAIGGGVLLAVGAFAYFSGSGPSKKDEEKIKEKTKAEAEKLKNKTLSEADRLKEKGKEEWVKIEGKDAGSVGELSGRKGGKGGFRAE